MRKLTRVLVLGVVSVLGTVVLTGCGEPTCKDGASTATELVGNEFMKKGFGVTYKRAIQLCNSDEMGKPNEYYFHTKSGKEMFCADKYIGIYNKINEATQSMVVLKDYNDKTGRSTCQEVMHAGDGDFNVEYTVQDSDDGTIVTVLDYNKAN